MGDFEGRHALIFASGPETAYGHIKAFLHTHPDVRIVCADGGLRHARALGLTPDLLVGDFDSGRAGQAGECIRLPEEKDDTDAQACLRELIRRGCRDMTLVCASGGRLDHLLANLCLLEEAFERGARCDLLDAQNHVVLHHGGCLRFKKDPRYHYFSLIPLDRELVGVTICGAKYPLKNARVRRATLITVSNEAKEAEVSVTIQQGRALLVCSRDVSQNTLYAESETPACNMPRTSI